MRTVVLTLGFGGLLVLAGAGLLGWVWSTRGLEDPTPEGVAAPLRITSVQGLRATDPARIDLLAVGLEAEASVDLRELRILVERGDDARTYAFEEMTLAWTRGEPEQGHARAGDHVVVHVSLDELALRARDTATVRVFHPAGDAAWRAFGVPPLDGELSPVALS